LILGDQETTASSTPGADLAPYSTDHRIAALTHDPAGVTLEWSDGRRSRFHALWLRDNCACPECRHPEALERTYIFVDHAAPVLARASVDAHGDLEVHFEQAAESHTSRFGRGWLRAHDRAECLARGRPLQPRRWAEDFSRELVRVDHTSFMHTGQGLRAWILALKTDGIVLIEGVPTVPGKLLEAARRIGPIRASNFGEYYDVVSMPKPNASAYTPMGLELHTDLPNWRSPPDVQLLFALKNSVSGGHSVFADGFAAAEDLRGCDPRAFELLATCPLEYRFHDERCDIRTSAPVIETGLGGELRRIRFNNWIRAATVFPEELTEPMYVALAKFWRMLRTPAHQLHLRLEPGHLIAYDNSRILHGRSPFDAASGERYLQGCYLNQEDVDSTLHLLERETR
jgi:gamma-butyrobetaine dioxygenase